MWIILGLLLSLPSFALESFERLKNVKILKVLDKNIIFINRGLEDGIQIHDHAKLSQEEEGYSARAICLKVKASESYWKLYRIPYSETISKDLSYTLVGMGDQEIPSPEAKLRHQISKLDDESPEKKSETGLDPFSVKGDLPDKITERDLIETVGPEQRKLFVEQALNQDQMKRDLKDFRVSLYASPFSRQSINNGQSYRLGARAGNVASKYRLSGQFEAQETQLTDPLTKEKVSTKTHQGQAQFVIHRLSESLSSLSLINYNSQYFTELGTPKSHWQIGVLGFTWHLFENKTWEYFDLSYIPLYDIRTTEVFSPTGTKLSDKKNGLRHGFRLGVKNRLNELVAFENLLWVRPYQELSSWELDSGNLNLVNDLKLIFNLSGNLFFDYNLIYQYDKLWKTQSGLPASNTINSVNLRYDFDL